MSRENLHVSNMLRFVQEFFFALNRLWVYCTFAFIACFPKSVQRFLLDL